MSQFDYQNGVLRAEGVALPIIAETFGTPTYVYSKAQLLENFDAYANACAGRDALVCYAMKANSNLAILDLLARRGAGFDIVSGGELLRVIAAGGDPKKVIFSGVGKSVDEMRLALQHDILCFNVESIPELHRLNEVAGALGKKARVSLRVNPNVDPKTHPYIATGLKASKFGVAFSDALDTYRMAAQLPHLDVAGIDCHIGSQLLDDTPLLEALDRLIELIDALAAEGIHLHHLDVGGGLGIDYGVAGEEAPAHAGDYVTRVFQRVEAWRAEKHGGKAIKVIFEPGRSIVGNTGVLLTKVEFIKYGEEKNFCIVDAAMNDMARPALYQAWMDMQPVKQATGGATFDVVGPICESGDWLARDRALAVEAGDLLVMKTAGAYGMTMASNYNTRGRAAEVIVDGDQVHLVRRRETPEELFALESLIR
ncbi:diaminopimelate decarboxylase [Pseudoduganella plicata]|uniref:Diaminopimelate decarboxylase n=1 Tax=Pseudoduganella plicata TaxID=321984 RepID=A0A4P7BGX0_9BURK|nr:diaminopimelate decarboxylase [Pseudoduganella plicata]QBQ37984.1 diaminopimelate decarboxylase [Pseudoduganella plicata]GGZ03947.1 diaminopimelate decarboxylase [Pseudoduganella plicata]